MLRITLESRISSPRGARSAQAWGQVGDCHSPRVVGESLRAGCAAHAMSVIQTWGPASCTLLKETGREQPQDADHPLVRIMVPKFSQVAVFPLTPSAIANAPMGRKVKCPHGQSFFTWEVPKRPKS
uniref:Uncharacterized protein n=1 Tax=Molossus molossus TaxID=27622 RepID=A0A7J8BN65_MOLMO|nr:hypothetical protein HJG59_010135 [Molossus molossus]